MPVIPTRLKKSICRKCSYFDLCWSGEDAGVDETASRNL